MSRSNQGRNASNTAVALQYSAGEAAPVVVASGMGYMAEKIVETAADAGVPIYEDNSLATALSQLRLGQEIPEELYQAIVEIYVYFLNFDPDEKEPNDKAADAARPIAPAEEAVSVPVSDQSEEKEDEA